MFDAKQYQQIYIDIRLGRKRGIQATYYAIGGGGSGIICRWSNAEL